MDMTFEDAALLVNDEFHHDTKKQLNEFSPAWLALLASLIPQLLKLCEDKTPEKLVKFCKNRKNVAARTVKNLLHEKKKYDKLCKCDDELARAMVKACANAEVEKVEVLRGKAMSRPLIGDDNSEGDE